MLSSGMANHEKAARLWLQLPTYFDGYYITHHPIIGGDAARLFGCHRYLTVHKRVLRLDKLVGVWLSEAVEALVKHQVFTRQQLQFILGEQQKPVQLSLF